MFTDSSTHRSLRSSLYPFIINQYQQRYQSNQQKTNRSSSIHQQKQIKFRPHLLQRYHDKSLIIKQKKPSKIHRLAMFLSKVNLLISKIFKKRYMQGVDYSFNTINPQSNYLFFWNVLVMIGLTFNFFQIPIAIFFTSKVYEDEFSNIASLIFNYTILAVLFINIVYVIPTTQFYQNGFLVTKNEDILKKYLKFQFFIDAIAWTILLTYIIIDNYLFIYFKLLFYVQIYALFKTLGMMGQRLQLTTIRLAIFKLIKLILFIWFIVVWLSCIYFYIDYKFYLQQNEYYPINLWITNSACASNMDIVVIYPDWWVWLNYSAYWTLQSISMVGYGDMTPRNPPQVIYCNLALLLMTLIYAFFISGVWQIIFQAREMTQYQRRQWKSFKIYQKSNLDLIQNVQTSNQHIKNMLILKNKVGSYLYTMWQQQKLTKQYNVVEIIEQSLTSELKDQLFINYRQKIFKKTPLFGQLVKDQYNSYQMLFQQLIFKVKQFTYGKDQMIYQANTVPNALFYLLKGRILIQYPNSSYSRQLVRSNQIKSIKSKEIEEDDHFNFGAKQFFSNQRTQMNAIAQYFCQVSELEYKDFINVIKQSNKLYNKYCQLRDQLKISKKYALTGEKCFECNNRHHQLIDCSQCQYFISKKQAIQLKNQKDKKQLYEVQHKKQSRKPFLRSKNNGKKIFKLKLKIWADFQQVKYYEDYFRDGNI